MSIGLGTPTWRGIQAWLVVPGVCILLAAPAASADLNVDEFCAAWDRGMKQGLVTSRSAGVTSPIITGSGRR